MSKKRKNEVSWKDLSIDVVKKLAAFVGIFSKLNPDQQKLVIKILDSIRQE